MENLEAKIQILTLAKLIPILKFSLNFAIAQMFFLTHIVIVSETLNFALILLLNEAFEIDSIRHRPNQDKT